MNIVDCGVCGNPCVDHNGNGYTTYISCCLPCSIKVHNAITPGYHPKSLSTRTDTSHGDGFPVDGLWEKEIEKMKVVPNNAIASVIKTLSNKYIDECPCGIHPSRCDFHR